MASAKCTHPKCKRLNFHITINPDRTVPEALTELHNNAVDADMDVLVAVRSSSAAAGLVHGDEPGPEPEHELGQGEPVNAGNAPPTPEPTFDSSAGGGKGFVKISDNGGGMRLENFVIGPAAVPADAQQGTGRHGMGLKDAIGILMRAGCTITIKTCAAHAPETFTFANHPSQDTDFGGRPCVHAHIDSSATSDSMGGTTIEIDGVLQQDYDAAFGAMIKAPEPTGWRDPEGKVHFVLPNTALKSASPFFRLEAGGKAQKVGAFFVRNRWVFTAKGGVTTFGYHIPNPPEEVRQAIDRDQLMKDGYKHEAVSALLADAWRRCAADPAAWRSIEKHLPLNQAREFKMEAIFDALPPVVQARMEGSRRLTQQASAGPTTTATAKEKVQGGGGGAGVGVRRAV